MTAGSQSENEFHRLWGSDQRPTVPSDGKTAVPALGH